MMLEVWFVYAFSAAILWGLSYSLSEHILKSSISPATILLIYSLLGVPIYGFIAYKNGNILKNIETLRSDYCLASLTVLIVVCYITANFLIFKSIDIKNAGLASLIEISYPLFTIFFTWLFFRNFQINTGTALGAFLIMAGVVTIYRFA